MKQLTVAIIVIVLAFTLLSSTCGQSDIRTGELAYFPEPFEAVDRGIVPLPVDRTLAGGEFLLEPATHVVAESLEHEDYALYLRGYIGFTANVDGDNGRPVVLAVDAALDIPEEGYRLSVCEDGVRITGRDRAGLFYGIQTFLQLLPETVFTGEPMDRPVLIPCQDITDHPRYGYRGMMLDIARTFTDKEGVIRFIDHMARHKLNRFHWHLTDDQGWRIEIKSYPELATLGGFRGGDSPLRHVFGAWNRKYGGYFTQDEIREVVQYAAFRNVEIVPEIDLPGHSRAIARLHPEILCPYIPDTTYTAGDIRNVWCASREENFVMLENILAEVCDLFPSETIHIGGDEVDPAQWKACPDCSRRMAGSGPEHLNGYFINRLREILGKYGRKTAAWNEAMDGGNLSKDVRLHVWENTEKSRKAVRGGHPMVLMPSSWFYFDMKQSEPERGQRWGGTYDARKVYGFEPEDIGVTAAISRDVAGMEGAFWAELYVAEEKRYLDYMTYPRICALAEVTWSPKGSRNWNEFHNRLIEYHYPRLDAMGINFRADVPDIKYLSGNIVLENIIPGAEVRYTSDGSEPGPGSPVYKEPLATSRPDRYLFKTFYGSSEGYPLPVPGVDQWLLTADYTVSSSMKATGSRPLSMASDNNPRTYARLNGTCRPGDWFLWTFHSPVDCESIFIQTGYTYMQKYNVPLGTLEVSYDGTVFETVETDFCTYGKIAPGKPVKAIRLTALTDNGEDAVFIQDLVIKKKD